MKVENPLAFSFILQDDIYLLNADKVQYSTPVTLIQENILAEPEVAYPSAPPETVKESLSLNYLGGNKKNFLVIAHYPEYDFMHDKHLAALESTLGRLGFSIEDIGIINYAKYQDIKFDVLVDCFNPHKLLVLGEPSQPAGIAGLELNKQKQLDNCVALLTFSFDDMMENNEKKKIFWEQMKQL